MRDKGSSHLASAAQFGAFSIMLHVKINLDVVKQFELWQSEGESIATTVCEVGADGDQCRALLESDAKLIWTFEGHSHLDTMQRYYDFMKFGTYTSDFPEIDCQPYYKTEAILALEGLPASIGPLREIKIFADGSTKPQISSPMPMLSIQDQSLFAIGIWITGDYGGHKENPINSAELLREVEVLIKSQKPHLLKRRKNTSLICPLDIAERMRWPANGKPRVPGDAEP
jgi:hypothetical protein